MWHKRDEYKKILDRFIIAGLTDIISSYYNPITVKQMKKQKKRYKKCMAAITHIGGDNCSCCECCSPYADDDDNYDVSTYFIPLWQSYFGRESLHKNIRKNWNLKSSLYIECSECEENLVFVQGKCDECIILAEKNRMLRKKEDLMCAKIYKFGRETFPNQNFSMQVNPDRDNFTLEVYDGDKSMPFNFSLRVLSFV